MSPAYNICIISDFFYPRLGGVELHQYQLAQALIQRGHKVVVVTGTYSTTQRSNLTSKHTSGGGGDDDGRDAIAYTPNSTRQSIRYLSNGLKVYHLPVISIHQQATIPTFTNCPRMLRCILHREQIDIVHGHQATSALMHEALLHATIRHTRTIYTDHSLFGLKNVGAITLNKLLQFTLATASHVICVSYCDKQNLCYRIKKHVDDVSVIPNAVDSTQFTPDAPQQQQTKGHSAKLSAGQARHRPDRLIIVIISRLVYRKGADLLVDVIPIISERHPHVDWLIGGDGNKQILLEQMREKYNLQDRVTLLGNIPHHAVRTLLLRGHVFLNCSLTEAFCIAILEAVSCGLQCVSTRVGGVSEILPHDLIQFAQPNVADIVHVLSRVVDAYEPVPDVWQQHNRVAQMYNWHSVAERTELVYDSVMQMPQPTQFDMLCKYYETGPFSGKLYCLVYCWFVMYHYVIDWLYPLADIDLAVDFKIH